MFLSAPFCATLHLFGSNISPAPAVSDQLLRQHAHFCHLSLSCVLCSSPSLLVSSYTSFSPIADAPASPAKPVVSYAVQLVADPSAYPYILLVTSKAAHKIDFFSRASSSELRVSDISSSHVLCATCMHDTSRLWLLAFLFVHHFDNQLFLQRASRTSASTSIANVQQTHLCLLGIGREPGGRRVQCAPPKSELFSACLLQALIQHILRQILFFVYSAHLTPRCLICLRSPPHHTTFTFSL